ncbi:MAG: PIN domain-containing protein [Acidimicrobiia bacterium]|nr:PIN domain-containing protein [Acidimicrobiia bacterium]
MRTVFADAGYWIALWHPRDALHRSAMVVSESLGAIVVVTTQLVLVEALNALAGMGEFRRLFAAQMVRTLEDDPGVEIVPQTDAQFRAAVERYATRPDQRWSLTDCASFLVMEERGISEALAYDRDFEQAGFTALLRGERT